MGTTLTDCRRFRREHGSGKVAKGLQVVHRCFATLCSKPLLESIRATFQFDSKGAHPSLRYGGPRADGPPFGFLLLFEPPFGFLLELPEQGIQSTLAGSDHLEIIRSP